MRACDKDHMCVLVLWDIVSGVPRIVCDTRSTTVFLAF